MDRHYGDTMASNNRRRDRISNQIGYDRNDRSNNRSYIVRRRIGEVQCLDEGMESLETPELVSRATNLL